MPLRWLQRAINKKRPRLRRRTQNIVRVNSDIVGQLLILYSLLRSSGESLPGTLSHHVDVSSKTDDRIQKRGHPEGVVLGSTELGAASSAKRPRLDAQSDSGFFGKELQLALIGLIPWFRRRIEWRKFSGHRWQARGQGRLVQKNRQNCKSPWDE
jgi:hypothetical protein